MTLTKQKLPKPLFYCMFVIAMQDLNCEYLVPVSTQLVPVSTPWVPVSTQLVPVSTQLTPVSTKVVPVSTQLSSTESNPEKSHQCVSQSYLGCIIDNHTCPQHVSHSTADWHCSLQATRTSFNQSVNQPTNQPSKLLVLSLGPIWGVNRL